MDAVCMGVGQSSTTLSYTHANVQSVRLAIICKFLYSYICSMHVNFNLLCCNKLHLIANSVFILSKKCTVPIQEEQYGRGDNGRHQCIKFDINLVKQRLQHGCKNNTFGNTQKHRFRAKITPDSNEDAVVELRREMKSHLVTTTIMLYHRKEMSLTIGQVCTMWKVSTVTMVTCYP